MKALSPFAVVIAAAVVAASPTARAVDTVAHVPVVFPRGASGATLRGSFRGYDSVEYTLVARAGQSLRVRVTGHGAKFNLFAPGDRPGRSTALGAGYVGADWTGTAPASGAYTIQVYQMRASARRGTRVDYTIRFDVSGVAMRGSATHSAARRFDASGQVPCASTRGQPMGRCAFVVTRKPLGVTTVLVMHGDGHRRAIYFQGGRAVGSDMPGGARAGFRASQESDLFIVRVGDERYEIPDVVVSGD